MYIYILICICSTDSTVCHVYLSTSYDIICRHMTSYDYKPFRISLLMSILQSTMPLFQKTRDPGSQLLVETNVRNS